MRWLAIHLPALPLEVLGLGHADQTPLAVSISRRGERILRCNPAAADCGVRPGLGVGAARALCAGLRILPRRPGAEREALERLAAWSLGFTPQVSLAPPRALLLEVAGSLALFGGPESLIGRVGEGLADLGYQARLALAPTPLGALVLARQGWSPVEGLCPLVPDGPALRSALGGLPLAGLGLGLGRRELEDLTRLGLRRVQDLLRLPRQGLRERLGPQRVDWLERLLGESPDPRPWYAPPPLYRGRIELPGEIELAESLLFPCRRLLLELAGLLMGRRAGARRLDWRLVHGDHTETPFSLGAVRPQWAPDLWLGLLRERLGRLALEAPVREVRLAVTEIDSLDLGSPEVSPDLFPRLAGAGRAPDPALLDRLRARLGAESVRGLALIADHRPERAWRWCEPGESGAGIPRADRPLWLLPRPQPLEERQGRPWLGGPLDLGQERERIDTGWWDGQEVARDYFVATGTRGARLWIYRDLKGPRGWYLHGLFG
jgi:protein ImuB